MILICGVVKIVWMIGCGSAMPVVSKMTWAMGCCSSWYTSKIADKEARRSPRKLQHMQPLFNWIIRSVVCKSNAWSTPVWPNSFSIIIISSLGNGDCASAWLIKVVFPAPKSQKQWWLECPSSFPPVIWLQWKVRGAVVLVNIFSAVIFLVYFVCFYLLSKGARQFQRKLT